MSCIHLISKHPRRRPPHVPFSPLPLETTVSSFIMQVPLLQVSYNVSDVSPLEDLEWRPSIRQHVQLHSSLWVNNTPVLFQFLKQSLTVQPRLAQTGCNPPASLSTVSTGITGMHHHTQLPGVLLIKFGSEIGKTLTSAWLNSALCDLLESQFQTASQEGRPGARNLSH